MFFIYVKFLSVSQGRDGGWRCTGSKSSVPGSERKREGQTGGREGDRDGTRDAVSSLERGLRMLEGAGVSLFDLRSRDQPGGKKGNMRGSKKFAP